MVVKRYVVVFAGSENIFHPLPFTRTGFAPAFSANAYGIYPVKPSEKP